jgi:hypothetical protein
MPAIWWMVMGLLKAIATFDAKLIGAFVTLVAAGMWIHAAVTFWNQNTAPMFGQKLLSCSSPEVVEGARTVFFKALVSNVLNEMGGPNESRLGRRSRSVGWHVC